MKHRVTQLHSTAAAVLAYPSVLATEQLIRVTGGKDDDPEPGSEKIKR